MFKFSVSAVQLFAISWYKSGAAAYEVFKEQRTATGLKLITKIEETKNGKIIGTDALEQRSEDVQRLEDEVEQLQDMVAELKFNKEIYGDQRKTATSTYSGDGLKSVYPKSATANGQQLSNIIITTSLNLLLLMTAKGLNTPIPLHPRAAALQRLKPTLCRLPAKRLLFFFSYPPPY